MEKIEMKEPKDKKEKIGIGKVDVYEEQKKLVLERFKTLSPESKIMLDDSEFTVKDIINHVEKGDEFGRKIVQTQIKMLKVLTSNV